MRLGVVMASNLGPYHITRYNLLCARGIDVTIAACPVSEYWRPWSFDREQVRFTVDTPFGTRPNDNPVRLLHRAREWLDRARPDAVLLVGYAWRYVHAVAWACRERGIGRILFLARGDRQPSTLAPRELVKTAICRTLFTSAVVPGVRSAAHAERLGLPPERIWRLTNPIDNDLFEGAWTPAAEPEARRLLYVGRFSPEKNLEGLLDAYERYRRRGGRWRLRLVGDGPSRETLAPTLRARPDVEWVDWVPYEELPAALRSGDALVLPSTGETWGLVVNEAMAAGLPVLVSRACGCYPELCLHGFNGFGFEAGDTEALARAMTWLDEQPAISLKAMGEASRRLVAGQSLESWVAGIARCMRTELEAAEDSS